MTQELHARLAAGLNQWASKALDLMEEFSAARRLKDWSRDEPKSPVEFNLEDFINMYYCPTKSPDEILMAKEDELLDPDKIWDRKWDKFTAIKISG